MIHTPTPIIELTEARLDRFFDSKECFYRATLKKMTKARAFAFKEISTFGAELHLIFESNEETEQLSKKKIRWSDLVHFFHGEKNWNKEFCKEFKTEIFKRALMVIKDTENE